MSNPNPLNATALLAIADELEGRHVPRLVESWRQEALAGRPVPAWRMRRQTCDALRNVWRHQLERGGRDRLQRGQAKAAATALRQLAKGLDAALLAADPASFPKLAGDTIRRHVGRR